MSGSVNNVIGRKLVSPVGNSVMDLVLVIVCVGKHLHQDPTISC